MKGNKEKVKKVLQEYKEGNLRSSSGEKVTDREQAIAIAMSEAGMHKEMHKAQDGVVVLPNSKPPSARQLLHEGLLEAYGGEQDQTPD